MLVSEVVNLLGPPDRTRGPDEFSSVTRQHFRKHSLFVDYDGAGRCVAVELYGDAPVALDGVALSGTTYRDMVARLRAAGAPVLEQRDGLRCDALGLSAYAPKLMDPEVKEAPLESVLVYAPGYYDELDATLARGRS